METSAEDGNPNRAVSVGAFAFAALTPPGEPDPSIAIAASRAGELGVLNLEYARDEQTALTAIDRLATAVGNRRFGTSIRFAFPVALGIREVTTLNAEGRREQCSR